MTGIRPDLLVGLPEDVRRLLAAPPVTEKKLLELSVSWSGLPADQERTADATRVFVITWDPLEVIPDRPVAAATINGPDDFELVIYAPLWSLSDLAGEQNGTFATVLSSLAGAAIVTAAAHEQAVPSGDYPALVSRRQAPDLLADPTAGAALGPAEIGLVSPDWEDLGLGAITDVVQQAFGPVDLDRSPVELAAAADRRLGCSACDGDRYGFPADLELARRSMCPAHQREASAVIKRRLARANASNPDGWAAIADASMRISVPHLPNGLAGRLVGAEDASYTTPEPDVLAERARVVIEAAEWFAGRPDDLAMALGEDAALGGQLPDWLVSLVLDLGRAGLGAEAVQVGDALTRVDPDRRAFVDGDVAVALAEAGLADEAAARVAENLTRWPEDFWVRLHAGDALQILGDLDQAEAHFRAALELAEQADDLEVRAYAVERLDQLHPSPLPERSHQRRRPRRKPSRAERKRR